MNRLLILIVLAAAALPALADERMQPVTDPETKAECSACHMAFPAGFLPARSWQAIMAGLDSHFGENAALAQDVTARIEAWLVANAADGRGRSEVLRGLDPSVTPLRISDLPWWQREHGPREVNPAAFTDPAVGSKANCVACHRGADRGIFEDD